MSTKEKNKKSTVIKLGFKTNTGMEGTFDAWNQCALAYVGTSMSALDPNFSSFHVYGDLYQVPNFARKGHETGGSVNVRAINLETNETIEFSHVFYIDTTGHGRGVDNHWNHELYCKVGEEEWRLFDKSKTEFHMILDSDNIIIWAKDSNGMYDEKKVEKIYRDKSKTKKSL